MNIGLSEKRQMTKNGQWDMVYISNLTFVYVHTTTDYRFLSQKMTSLCQQSAL